MNRLLLSLVPLTDRPTSYLTRKAAASRTHERRTGLLPRRTPGARAARFALGVGVASALLIGTAHIGDAADVKSPAANSVLNVADFQPADNDFTSFRTYILSNTQTDLNSSARGGVDITSIGVPQNSNALTAASIAAYAPSSNGLFPAAADRSTDSAPAIDPARNVLTSRSAVPAAWLDTRTLAVSPANGLADTVPATPAVSVSGPPDPAKSDVYSKSGRNAPPDATPDAIPGPSKLIGALLACALMLWRPRRNAGY